MLSNVLLKLKVFFKEIWALILKLAIYFVLGVVVFLPLFLFVFQPSEFRSLRQFCPDFIPQCRYEGRIFIDSPEVYTRERLVNDRFNQEAWLKAELKAVESLDFGIQRARSSSGSMDVSDGNKQEKPAESPKPGDLSEIAPHPEIKFRQRASLREKIRQLIIENQLDDRHDLDGSTLYMIKFDVSVLPKSSGDGAVIEVDLHPDSAPSPLDQFDHYIPDYVDIPYLKNSTEQPKFKLFERWRDEVETSLNSLTTDVFDALLHGTENEDITRGFYNFLIGSKNWMALDAELEQILLSIPKIDGQSASEEFMVWLNEYREDEVVWRYLRPYVNMYALKTAHELRIGATRDYSFYVEDLERSVHFLQKGETTPFNPYEANEFANKDSIEREKDILAVLRSSTRLSFVPNDWQHLVQITLSWDNDTRTPPLVNLVENKSNITLLSETCAGYFNSFRRHFPEIGRLFQTRHYYAPAEQAINAGNLVKKFGKFTLYAQQLPVYTLTGKRHHIDTARYVKGYWNKRIGELAAYIAAKHSGRNVNERFWYRVYGEEVEGKPFRDLTGVAATLKFKSDQDQASFDDIFQPADLTEKQQSLVRLIYDLENECSLDKALSLSIQTGFYNFIEKNRQQTPFSYATLPRVDFNLSESQSNQQMIMNLGGALSKVVGQDAGYRTELNRRIKQSEAEPVLIGYGSETLINSGNTAELLIAELVRSGYDEKAAQEEVARLETSLTQSLKVPKVGWALYPGISSRVGNSGSMQPTQQSLSALFSVPSWWTNVKLGVNVGWINNQGQISYIEGEDSLARNDDTDTGNRKSLIELTHEKGSIKNCEYTHCFLVPLPEDYSSIADNILGEGNQRPKISKLETDLKISVRSCREASITIPGQRLWRNTSVTLGGQVADKIEVLPNMRGVVASFSPVDILHYGTVGAGGGEADNSRELIIWTSEGKVSYPGEIVIEPPFDGEVNNGVCVNAEG